MPLQFLSFIRRLFRHRSTRVTPEGLQFLIFTLAIGIAAINTGNNLFYLLLAMMLSLILVSGILAEYCLRGLEFHRHLPDLIFVNEPITAALVVKNRKTTLPSFSLTVSDVSDDRDMTGGLEVHQLLPGVSRLLPYPMISPRRGKIRLEGVWITTEFPFGLFTKKMFYPMGETVVVCPEIKPLEESLLQGLLTPGYDQTVHRRGQGNELYNLRLYHAGDDSRSIHWPTTARTSQLTVRETEAEDQRRATIYLPTVVPATHDDKFEQAVSLTASLVHHLTHRRYLLKLVVGSDHSAFGQGETHYVELLRMLARCERSVPVDVPVAPSPFPVDSLECENAEGTVIVVQVWQGEEDSECGAPTILVDGQPIG